MTISETIALYTTFFLMTFSEDYHSLSVQTNLCLFCRDLMKLSLLTLHSVNPKSLVLARDGQKKEGIFKSLNTYIRMCQKSRQSSRSSLLIRSWLHKVLKRFMRFHSIFRSARGCTAEASKPNLHGPIYCDVILSVYLLLIIGTTARIQGLFLGKKQKTKNTLQY